MAGGVAGLTMGAGLIVGAKLGLGTGLAAHVAAGAAAGAASGQAARATDNVASGRPVGQGLGDVQDIVVDATLGGGSAGLGYGIGRGVQALVTRRLQSLTSSANARLAADLRLAQTVLSEDQYASGQTSARVAPMQYGHAVERLVARDISRSRVDRLLFEYVSSPSRPDFVGRGLLRGMRFDITTDTPRQLAEHALRSYRPIVITYTRPASFTVFPR